MTRLLIGGDCSATGVNLPLFRAGDAQGLFRDLLPRFADAGLALVNLEGPLIARPTPIAKDGPVLGAPEECVRGLRAAGVDVVNLANNHVLDHGPTGAENTVRCCAEAGLATVGVGPDRATAGELLVREVDGRRVAVVSMAEHEFSVADAGGWGANPLDPVEFVRHVDRHRRDFDHLVAILHAGNYHHPYPRPSLRELCRFFVEQGADAVVCQQSHCPGTFETYRGSPIVYGQGNLIFDWPTPRPTWRLGYLVQLELNADGGAAIEIVPFEQRRGESGAHALPPDRTQSFLADLEERSRRIDDDEFLERSWSEYCASREAYYWSILRGHGRPSRWLNARLRFASRLYSRPALLRLLNAVRCESHHEALQKILSDAVPR